MTHRTIMLVLIVAITSFSQFAYPQKSLPVKEFDDEVSRYVIDSLSKVGENKSLSTRDISWAQRLYSAALRTKIARREFLSAVTRYDEVLIANRSFLEKEEAYYEVGLTADSLLTAVERLYEVVGDEGMAIDLNDRSVADELGLYIGQRGAVLHSVIDKPKLLGMTKVEVEDLLRRLNETGKHLDVAVDSLRSRLLQCYPNQDLTLKPTTK